MFSRPDDVRSRFFDPYHKDPVPASTLLLLHPLAGTPCDVVHVDASPFSIGGSAAASWRIELPGIPERVGVILPHALGCRLVGFAAPARLNGAPIGPEADARHGDLLEVWPGWRFVIRLPSSAHPTPPLTNEPPRLLLSEDGPSRRDLERARRRRMAWFAGATLVLVAVVIAIRMRRPPVPAVLSPASAPTDSVSVASGDSAG